MSVDKKILEEITKYNNINKYISEQDETLPPPNTPGDEGEDLNLDGVELEDELVQSVDVDSDPDVEVVDEPNSESVDVEETGTEELDITDLVTTQKDMSKKQEEYMDSMMDRLNDLTSKLADMDTILNKINDLETKVDKYRQKSPEEKLQLRSLDSYPYNQKLTDFFVDKGVEMEKTGKNEYVLTSDEVDNFSRSDIKKSFDTPFEDEY
jgi:hypothetical protein|tara:strand:- start:24541 stop:25167 length:627 start_codon:yes stop_codon:yes gene_type:complete